MDLRFTSGQICKIFNITKQTLLFYDKMDILKPKYVDSNNGYRYYSLDQFDLLYLILSLKETNMPLKEIKTNLTHRTLEKNIDLLENQIVEIENKIFNLETTKRRLQKSLTRIKEVDNIKNANGFTIKYAAEKYLFSMPVQDISELQNFNLTLSRIREHITNSSNTCFWDVGCVVSSDAFGELTNYEMFVVMDDIFETQYLKLKPAGLYLCTYHFGTYDTLDTTYKKLFNYMKSNGFDVAGDIYEGYIVDILNTDNKNDFITELSVKVDNGLYIKTNS
ncbi:MAG: MerR family transcriptional regulator [Clostridiaceae bacterium]|nr:MerR family transcriptional regulator [Clostridiaceae bacterium]